jgi:type IV pilus assembly protein PilM
MALKNRNIIGADIGAGTVQLVNTNGKGKVTRAVSFDLPDGVVTQMQISTPEILTRTIKSAKRAGSIQGSKCILSLGGTDVIIRHLLLPVMNDAQIYENVISEISAYLPVDTENYSIDYSIQEEASDEASAQLKVMVVAIPKNPLRMYIDCFKKAGIRVAAIDISENAQEKLIRYLLGLKGEPSYNFGVIDLGSETTNITTYLGGRFFVNKVAGIGGDILTNDLAEVLSMDTLAAEAAKRQENYFRSSSPAQSVVASYGDNIIFEANRVFDYFTNRNNRQIIEKVFLCGGGASLPGLSEYLQRYLDIEIESLETLMSPIFANSPVLPNCSIYAAAVGATFREV